MEHMIDTEEAYLTEMPRSLNTVVKAHVQIGGQPFEGILDTGASDSAISMDVVRRLGLLDRMTPSDLTFLTAGGSERPEGVLLALPIRIGRLDTMVTPAQNYNILVGNDWLRMAGADMLLSKSILCIRLGAEHWEDVPIDAEMIRRRLNICLRQVSSTVQTPQQAVLVAVAREAESSIIRQSCIQEEDASRTRNQEWVTSTKRNHKQKTFCAVSSYNAEERGPLAAANCQ